MERSLIVLKVERNSAKIEYTNWKRHWTKVESNLLTRSCKRWSSIAPSTKLSIWALRTIATQSNSTCRSSRRAIIREDSHTERNWYTCAANCAHVSPCPRIPLVFSSPPPSFEIFLFSFQQEEQLERMFVESRRTVLYLIHRPRGRGALVSSTHIADSDNTRAHATRPTDRKSDEPGNRWPPLPPPPPLPRGFHRIVSVPRRSVASSRTLRSCCCEDDFKRDFYKKTSV